MTGREQAPPVSQTLSVVIPVYRAGPALEATCREILEVCTDVSPVPTVAVRLEELILVCDNPGLPDDVLAHLAGLADLDERVRVVWLSRNFGQHPATVAGIVSTNGDWVVTMDEDGQHDPAFIRDMLATAGRNRTPLVYAAPTNARPHGAMRNAGSWVSGRVARSVSGVPVRFHSFRLLEGGLARSACAYAGENVFLDVALAWTCGTPSACPVQLRQESVPSAYSYRRLLSHFWRLVVSSGTRPLRAIAAAGLLVAVSGLARRRVHRRAAAQRGDRRAGMDVGDGRPARAAGGAVHRGGGGRGVRGPGRAQHGRATRVRAGGRPRGAGAARAAHAPGWRRAGPAPRMGRGDGCRGRPQHAGGGGGGRVGRACRGRAGPARAAGRRCGPAGGRTWGASRTGPTRGRPGAVRLIAGASGVLGSGFCEVLAARGEAFTRMELPWHDPAQVAERVLGYWRAAEAAHPRSPITLVWAAGTGTVAAPEEAMVAETEVLRAVVAALGERVHPNMANCLLFASSAGRALRRARRRADRAGRHRRRPSPPTVGRRSLQEGIVASLQEAGTMRTVSCRFTNVFGLADGRLRRKGLVAVLVHSAMLRQPARLFVSPDTRRDYLYNVDAARLALAEADAATAGAATVTIVRAGSTMTVLDLVATTSRVLRRRVPVVITESPEGRVQPMVLRFHQRSGIQAAIPTSSFEAAIRTMAEAPRG